MKAKTINILNCAILLPFGICVLFLNILGKCLGISYKQISVIFNLWIQGTILAASSLLPFIAQSIVCFHSPTAVNILFALALLCYASIYALGLWAMLKHYHLPYDYAFDLCVDDLSKVAYSLHISYHAVNLIIFVLWWLAAVFINCYLAFGIIPA